LNPDACLGMIQPLMSPTGECAPGYYGALCSSCMPKTSRSDSYECEACPDEIYNILRISGIMIALTFGLVMLVKSTLAGAVKKNTHSVLMKILMNHMQMILITASFDLDWPPQVKEIFASSAPIAEITNAIVSFDCWMDSRNPENVDKFNFRAGENEWRVIYQKLMINAVLPIIMCAASYSVWWLVLKK